jgi:hypothetical protein
MRSEPFQFGARDPAERFVRGETIDDRRVNSSRIRHIS